jgi:hypothetical protein
MTQPIILKALFGPGESPPEKWSTDKTDSFYPFNPLTDPQNPNLDNLLRFTECQGRLAGAN